MQKVPMVKVIRMVKRRADWTLPQFKDTWLKKHSPMVLRAMDSIPVQKVVATFSTGEVALGGKESPIDAMVCLYFKNVEDARAALAGPSIAAMREDENNFAEPGAKTVQLLADEYLMSQRPGPAGAMKTSGQLKALRTVYRRRDLTPAQFKDYWLQNHSKLEDKVIEMSAMQRIVATFAIPQDGKQPDIDGMAELYFASAEDIRTMFAGPVPAMMRKDEENFVQMDAPAIRLVTEEYVLADKTGAK